MKENLRRIGTWARRQGEHFDLYLHALPQRTRLTLIFAILALLSVTLLFICGSIYRIGRNDGFNARRIDTTRESPPLPRNGAAMPLTSVPTDALRADRTGLP
uniref:hypothetical protein n=1 Tax=Alistipes communis TaxID=2585118 RepID=UPI003FD7E19E